ncbi:hypothetical protein [Halomonas daqiaonensis]|uniref:Uncharacterized protein n=1 Tax=Halomonas daqiaonensis TaxID=650850 RepID=A0A1H7SFY2_9GAMM|nr:hypothetical protein [Halomonas daqiaonensis]SEL71550.1 hypothetical protein SAMN04488129_11495 [Halomonas daqiaonensis]
MRAACLWTTTYLTAIALGAPFYAAERIYSLTLSRDDSAITLAATPFGPCKDQYGGARAALGTISLPLSSRSPLPAPFEQISVMETPLCR